MLFSFVFCSLIRTSTERPEALDKACFFIAGIDEVSLLQAVDTAVTMNQNGDYGIPRRINLFFFVISTKVEKSLRSLDCARDDN